MVLCTAMVIVNLDNTILNVALPTLVRTLNATSSQLQRIVDAYAIVFAGLVLVGGSLADRFGRKRLFLTGLSVFVAGSIGAAFSGSVTLLIGFRAFMGVGAALTMPATLSIIKDILRDPAERAGAIGAWAGPTGLGIAIGPIPGGPLLSRFWRGSVFLVNVPFVIIGFVGALLLVPDSKNPAADPPDPIGAMLSIAGFGLLVWGIIEGPSNGWTSGSVVGVGSADFACIGGFVAWELHSSHPTLKLAFFSERRCSIAAAAECLGILGLFGALFELTQFLQFDLGLSPLQAGLRILPIGGLLVVVAAVSPVVVRSIGNKFTIALGLAAAAGGLWQISAAFAHPITYGDIVPGLVLIGAGAGLLMPTATNCVIGSVPQGDAGVGSATNVVAIQVGGTLGVAVIGSILSTRFQDHLASALATRRLPPAATHAALGALGGALGVAGGVGVAAGAQLAQVARSAFINGANVSLLVAAGIVAGGGILVLARLPSRSRATAVAPRVPHERVEPKAFVGAVRIDRQPSPVVAEIAKR